MLDADRFKLLFGPYRMPSSATSRSPMAASSLSNQARDGRPHVVDAAGLPVYGVWILTPHAEGEMSIVAQAPRC